MVGSSAEGVGRCTACGASSLPGERFCERCGTTADGLTPAIDLTAPAERASGTHRVARRPATDSDVHPPGALLGAYRIIELIGCGGIGQVYVADHVRLGRRVALKRLRSQYGRIPAAVSRFFAEARAANQMGAGPLKGPHEDDDVGLA